MTKKVSALLVLNTSILIPIISTPLLVSCKNIDYKKDVKEDFTKNKSTIFASESISYIKLGSKSGKVKYEAQLVSSNDKTGEATIKITPIQSGKVKTAFEVKITGFKIKLSEVLKDVKSLDLTEKEKYKVDDYISKFSTTLKDKVIVKTSDNLTLTTFLNKNKLDGTVGLKIKDLEKGIGTLNVQFKLGEQIETKELEISGFLSDNIFASVINKILTTTTPMDLSDKSDKTVSEYNTQFGSNLKDKITCQVEGKSWTQFLTEQGFEIGSITLEAKSDDSKIGILKITITKDSKNETFTKEIDGFKENTQQPQTTDLNKAFEEALTLDGIEDKTIEQYKTENPDLTSKVKTATKSNEEYKQHLANNNIELDTISLEEIAETKANLKVKVKSKSDPTKVLEKEFEIDGFQRKLSEILKEIKSLDLVDKDKYKVDDYISNFTTTLKDKVIVKTSEDLTLATFLTMNKLDADVSLTPKDLDKGIATLNVKFKLGSQTETKETEVPGFLGNSTFSEIINKILTANPAMDLLEKSDKTVSEYNTKFGSNLKDKIACQVEGKSWSDFLTDQGFTIGAITLTTKSGDSTTGILQIPITKDSKTENITKEISGFKEEAQQPEIDLNKAFEEDLTLDDISNEKTVEQYNNENPDLKIKVKTQNKTNEQYLQHLTDNNIELDTITLEATTETKANLKVKVKNKLDPTKTLERIFELDGFKSNSVLPPTPPAEPTNAFEAAQQGKLITIEKTSSTYNDDIEAIKKFFVDTQSLSNNSRRLDETKNGTWTLKSKGKGGIIANLGESIKFDEKWGKYKDVIKPAKGNGKFAQINIEKDGSNEIIRIYIEFKIDGHDDRFEVEFWKKDN
ncbi:hypothetical protein PUW95_02645 [Metamycoplasma hyosynoviae]|uniref:hypothetical protein n=1 Tax=Metamycoplasma hyosynoviae TaxID=29559 RepID=UPI002366E9D3|nr:hypothetical protein [Metamycoplasma hyosynoviae]MDD7897613.1 hypothetical protein [Metamycoplasma hyosynoviae]